MKYLDLLGKKVEDKVTGVRGVATSISFDLYGCIQAIVTPQLDKDGKPGEARWFDVARLKVLSDKPVMEQPHFSAGNILKKLKGPAEKPAISKP